MQMFSLLLFRVSEIPIKVPAYFVLEIDKKIQKLIQECKVSGLAKQVWKIKLEDVYSFEELL